MTTAIVATVAAASPVPVVQLNVTIDNPDQVQAWSIYRYSALDAQLPVWKGFISSGAYSLTDYTAPLGIPVTYQMTVVYPTSTVTVTSTAVTITGTTGCYLTNPASGITLQTEIQSWPDRTRQPRQAVLDVLGRADPVVLSDVHRIPSGTWVLVSRTDSYTASLIALLTAQALVILRTQAGSSIPNVSAAVGQIAEHRYSNVGGDQRRLIDVDLQEIAPLPATALPLNATLGGLAVYQGITTLSQMALLRPTLQQLSEIPTG